MLSRTVWILAPCLLLLAACSDDDPSSPDITAGSGGAAGQSSAGAGGQSSAGAAGMSGAGGAGASPTAGEGTLTATVDGAEVPAEGKPVSALMNASQKLYIARGKSTTDPYIEMEFQNNDGFTKPLVIPAASNGTKRQSHVNVNGAEYWASRQGSHTVEDTLQVVDGRIKGTWTYTSRAWGNGTGPEHTVVLTVDVPLPTQLQ